MKSSDQRYMVRPSRYRKSNIVIDRIGRYRARANQCKCSTRSRIPVLFLRSMIDVDFFLASAGLGERVLPTGRSEGIRGCQSYKKECQEKTRQRRQEA